MEQKTPIPSYQGCSHAKTKTTFTSFIFLGVGPFIFLQIVLLRKIYIVLLYAHKTDMIIRERVKT